MAKRVPYIASLKANGQPKWYLLPGFYGRIWSAEGSRIRKILGKQLAISILPKFSNLFLVFLIFRVHPLTFAAGLENRGFSAKKKYIFKP